MEKRCEAKRKRSKLGFATNHVTETKGALRNEAIENSKRGARQARALTHEHPLTQSLKIQKKKLEQREPQKNQTGLSRDLEGSPATSSEDDKKKRILKRLDLTLDRVLKDSFQTGQHLANPKENRIGARVGNCKEPQTEGKRRGTLFTESGTRMCSRPKTVKIRKGRELSNGPTQRRGN